MYLIIYKNFWHLKCEFYLNPVEVNSLYNYCTFGVFDKADAVNLSSFVIRCEIRAKFKNLLHLKC